ncbi:M23 family metallopeptidase [Micromonospora sp. MA102]|uniref:M23 family metallopeptidase n=1 Tax=Micromonospora sp. MA102 TaxID=2952755 RepID=UPI0021C8E102|nr:M23 family metallopeptidase [Micromonospora sp. MA102]
MPVSRPAPAGAGVVAVAGPPAVSPSGAGAGAGAGVVAVGRPPAVPRSSGTGAGAVARPVAVPSPARSGAPAAGVPAGRFRWPLAGTPRVARRFDPPPEPWLPGHRGVDLAARPGVGVRSAGAGVVLFAGMVAGRPVVTVGHANGLRTTYEPVLPGPAAGARVAAGAAIGLLTAGHPGCVAAACLHWGLRRGEEYLDPLALLGLGPVRLLPLDPPPAGPAGQAWASSVGSRTASRSYSSGVL